MNWSKLFSTVFFIYILIAAYPKTDLRGYVFLLALFFCGAMFCQAWGIKL